MSPRKLSAELAQRSTCPIATALDIVGDKWTLLIVRDIGLFGKHRNKDFQDGAEGFPTNILANRLKRMVEQGILERRPYQERPLRHEYHLTESGKAMLPVVKALARWSLDNVAGVSKPGIG